MSSSNFPNLQDSNVSFKEKIGRGAFGVVFKCLYNGTDAAVKVQNYENYYEKSQFEDESEIMRSLAHPNIVNYYDSFTNGHQAILVMELAPKGNLSSVMDAMTVSCLEEPQVAKVAYQLLSALDHCHSKGLDHCHSKGIVHGDIDKENVVVMNDSFDVKLIDFGIAFMIPSDQNGTVKSQAYYRIDIHGLGFLLMELLLGLERKPVQDLKCKEKVHFPVTPRLSQQVKRFIEKSVCAEFSNAADLLSQFIILDSEGNYSFGKHEARKS